MSDTVQAEAPEDIRTALSAAFDAAQEPPEQPAVAQEPETPEAALEPSERPRGPDGKFLPKETAAEQPEPADKTPEAKPEPQADDPLAKATARWSAADREMLAKLPPEAQQFVVRRHREMEADLTRKTQEIADFRKTYDPVDQLFAPHRDIMRAGGHSVASLVQGWIGAEKALMDPKSAPAFMADVARRYNIDPAAVIQALGGAPKAAEPQQGAEPTPQPPALPPEITAQLRDLQQWRQQFQAQQFQSEAGRVMSAIETFKSATDQNGNPLHPHFDAVERDMALMADVMRARGEPIPPLADLYERAVWANPSTKELKLADMRAAEEAQRAQAEQQRQREARAKAEQARRAAAPVTGAPGPGQTQARRQAEGSLRETLESAFADMDA